MKYIKNLVLLFFVLAAFYSCKPVIRPITLGNSTFCPCGDVAFFYQVDGAESAEVIISPASALAEGSAVPRLRINNGAAHQAFVKVCSDATITVRAVNSNGTSEQSASVSVFTGSSTQSITLEPRCGESGFQGWNFTPASGLPQNIRIRSFLFRTDRAGELRNGSGLTSIISNAGTHRVTIFNNSPFYSGSYFFIAPLRSNERCAPAGNTLPDGTVAPPNQSATVELGCP